MIVSFSVDASDIGNKCKCFPYSVMACKSDSSNDTDDSIVMRGSKGCDVCVCVCVITSCKSKTSLAPHMAYINHG